MEAPTTVPISKALRVVLALPLGVGAAPVFVGLDGSALTLPEVRRAFGVAKLLAGIRDELSLYSIRHTFAPWLAIQGHPLRTIRELLDHADVRMTLRYAHLSPAHLQSAVESIGAAEKSIGQRAGNAEARSEESESAANPVV